MYQHAFNFYPIVEESRKEFISKNLLLRKSLEFSIEIIGFCKALKKIDQKDIASQLLRSATSIGANANEATAAISRNDFIHKITLASKEARESYYWLLLIDECEDIPLNPHRLMDSNEELIRICTAIVKTTRKQ